MRWAVESRKPAVVRETPSDHTFGSDSNLDSSIIKYVAVDGKKRMLRVNLVIRKRPNTRTHCIVHPHFRCGRRDVVELTALEKSDWLCNNGRANTKRVMKRGTTVSVMACDMSKDGGLDASCMDGQVIANLLSLHISHNIIMPC